MLLDRKKIFFFVSDLQAKEFLEFCNLYGDVDDVWNLKQCCQLYFYWLSIFQTILKLWSKTSIKINDGNFCKMYFSSNKSWQHWLQVSKELMDTQNKILTKEQDVNCSKKHCHSKDLSHRQCQRFSMIFPTDNKIEILLCEMATDDFCCLCLYFFLCCSANCAHWSFTVFINWLCDSMSWCKTWKIKQKLGW